MHYLARTAAGHAVAARGGDGAARPVNREPTARRGAAAGIPASGQVEDVNDRPSLVWVRPCDTVLGEEARRLPGDEVICKSPVTGRAAGSDGTPHQPRPGRQRGISGARDRAVRRRGRADSPGRQLVPFGKFPVSSPAGPPQPAASAETRPAASGSARPRPTAIPTRYAVSGAAGLATP